MAALLASAVLTCVASLFLGQAALRLAGAREWNWLAPPVGISVAMLISAMALWAPGGCTTIGLLLAALTIAAIVWCGLDPAQRPPLSGILAALPVALLVLVPFLVAGHGGALGVGIDNDMASHMQIVEHYISPGSAPEIAPPGYPIAGHGMVALLAKGLGARVDYAFAGWSMALPMISAWTALALVPRASWPRRMLVATVVGMPFLIAAYYGEGAFKEVLQACLVLATALFFAGRGPSGLGRGRWVPLALIVGGIVSIYSVPGLPWPMLFAGLWFLVTVGLRIRRSGTGGLLADARPQLPALLIGAAVLIIALLPQVSRIWTFAGNSGGTGLVPGNTLGNLLAPLPLWEGFGVWNNPEFRLPASPAFTEWIWVGLVLGLALLGVAWGLRRGRWMMPLAAGGALLIWAASRHSQSPYVTAKALVILSPLLLALAVAPLVEQAPEGRPRSIAAHFRRPSGQWLPWGLAAILATVLLLRVGLSDAEALRASPVGPVTHTGELRELRPLMEGKPTLFLGNDDYIRWELSGVPVRGPVIGLAELPTRPRKPWTYGEALDFDSVGAKTLNEFDWVLTTRDAAGSDPPAGMRFVRSTPNFELWRRVRRIAPRSILDEGEMPGAVLDCRTPAGRAVLRAGGVAAVRAAPVAAEGTLLPPGASLSVKLQLPRGLWQLQASYVSRFPIHVTAPGLDVTLPGNLDRPGPRWPVGQISAAGGAPTTVTYTVEDPFGAPPTAIAEIGKTVAARIKLGLAAPALRRKDTIVPMSRACGRYVDWYRSAR